MHHNVEANYFVYVILNTSESFISKIICWAIFTLGIGDF